MNTKDLRSQLDNTLLPLVLIDVILKYSETSIKVEFSDFKTIYVDQSEFSNLDCKDVLFTNIYGILKLTNPIDKFKNSKIQSIIGHVILKGNVNNMFHSAKNFNPDNSNSNSRFSINNWNTTNVTNMSHMFYNATEFNSNISDWDTSNVTNMSDMFYSATEFNSNINASFSISGWNTSNVTNMSNMFYNAVKFNSDLSLWNTSKVEDMRYMFCNVKLNYKSGFNISDWNTSNVTNMRGMFFGATNFNSDLSKWNTIKVADMNNMFLCTENFKGKAVNHKGYWEIIYTG
jgi:surface protein